VGRAARPVAVALAVAGVAAATLAAAPASAQQDRGAEGVQVDVEAGIDGRYLVGRRLPVTVTIEADRLVRGTVEVAVDGLAGTWSVPVEVPGGSTKEVVVVVPSPVGFAIGDVAVRLLGAGDAVVVEAEVEPLQADELAGLLPGVAGADVPEPLALPEGLGVAHFATLDPDDLVLAGAADPFGTIVAGPDEVGTLDATARANLADWVDRGGRLVVDSQPGTPVSGLPDPWQPGPAGRVAAGLGEVRQSGGRAAAGDWGAVVQPTPTASMAEFPEMGEMGMIPEPVADALARDAGIDALDLPWLLAFLAAYVLLAGPIAYVLLRKRRASLGWVAIPALAIAFTAVAFVVGSDLRGGTTTAHGTVLEQSPAVDRATTVVGTVSRSGRDGSAAFPAGWTAAPVDPGPFAQRAPTDVAVSTTQAGSAASMPLTAGDFGVVRGTGPVEGTGDELVVIEATSVDEGVAGTVTNQHPFTLEDAGVFLGRAAVPLGDIGPGETVDFEIQGSEFRMGDPWSPPDAAVWPDQSGFSGDGRVGQSAVNLGLLAVALEPLGPNARPRGIATVVGWTRDLPSPLRGGADGRSAVVTRAAVTAAPGALGRGAARRELLRGPEGIDVADADLGRDVRAVAWQFDVPPGTDGVTLGLSVPTYVHRVDVWDGQRWATVDDTDGRFDGNFNRTRQVTLPAALQDRTSFVVRGFLQVDAGPVGGDGIDLVAITEAA
jgi:hypothetical protein